VFGVKGRQSLIQPAWKETLYKYISGVITNQDQKLYIINGMPDHVHILVSCKPTVRLSDLVKEIKEHSTKYVNQHKLVTGNFNWQVGYGAFAVCHRHVDVILNYIKNQEEHHKQQTFREEYIEFLKENNVEFKEEYLFEEVV
jgi:REP element-mobilizing transposase RayT